MDGGEHRRREGHGLVETLDRLRQLRVLVHDAHDLGVGRAVSALAELQDMKPARRGAQAGDARVTLEREHVGRVALAAHVEGIARLFVQPVDDQERKLDAGLDDRFKSVLAVDHVALDVEPDRVARREPVALFHVAGIGAHGRAADVAVMLVVAEELARDVRVDGHQLEPELAFLRLAQEPFQRAFLAGGFALESRLRGIGAAKAIKRGLLTAFVRAARR